VVASCKLIAPLANEGSFFSRLICCTLVLYRVLQRYIANPLLLRQRKFHIRAYILAVSALTVYLNSECLALCAGTSYQPHNAHNLFSHITNTAFQDQDPHFNESECVLVWNDHDIAPLLMQSGMCSSLADAQRRIVGMVESIQAIVADLFRAYQSEFGVFSPIPGCFEHYGLDFLVDDAWNVYLLEGNPGPDFKQTGDRLQGVIGRLMQRTIEIVFEESKDTPGMIPCISYDAVHPSMNCK
jgi:tubulin---tyrosine ligase